MRILRVLRSRVGLLLALAADLLVRAGPHDPYAYSPASFRAALAVQEHVTDDWLALEGVVGTAIGVDGSGSAVLKVYLTAAGAAALPQTVDGVSVVPEVTGRFVSRAGVRPGLADADAVDPTAGFVRPVPIGVSAGHPSVTAGTLGARVTDGQRVYALSNNHVAAANNGARPGDAFLQPGALDGGQAPRDAVGTLHDFEPIRFCTLGVCPLNRIDAAVALTTTDDVRAETPEDGYGAPRTGPVEAKLGMKVQKYGRTTGLTHGRITGVHAVLDVGYRGGTAGFEDQIVISGEGFSAGGDAGSLIVTDGAILADRRPVGLLFAGTSGSTVANPIDLVLTRFGVRVDGGP